MKTAVLITVASVYGSGGAYLFRRFTDPARARSAMNRLLAHVMELHLYAEEPRLVLRAQRDLLAANFHLLRLFVTPLVSLAILFALLAGTGYRWFDTGSLHAGTSAIARARSIDAGLKLLTPNGIEVETPALRLPNEDTTLWRVRATTDRPGPLTTNAGQPVVLDLPGARYFGLSWLNAFALISLLAGSGAHILFQKLHAFKRD
jgi:hypothetical protein